LLSADVAVRHVSHVKREVKMNGGLAATDARTSFNVATSAAASVEPASSVNPRRFEKPDHGADIESVSPLRILPAMIRSPVTRIARHSLPKVG
jgi:hypothetical protein